MLSRVVIDTSYVSIQKGVKSFVFICGFYALRVLCVGEILKVHSLKIRFYWDLCGYMSSFPQKNKIASLKFSNFLNPRAADLIC
jgi:hypothetical protein